MSIKDLNPEIDEVDADLEFCEGNNHTLKSMEVDPTYSYIWFKDGLEVQNSNNPEYIVVGDKANSGTYQLRVVSVECDKMSVTPINITIVPNAISKIKYTSLYDCTSVTLEADSDLKGADPTKVVYEWYDISSNFIKNGTTLTVNQSGAYKLVTLNHGICSSSYDEVGVHINNLDPEIDEIAPNVEVCVGASHTLKAIETDILYTYIWYRDGVEVQNSNNPEYIVAGLLSDKGVWNYTLRVISPECNKTSVNPIIVTIKDAPIATVVYKDGIQKGCSGDVITLQSGSTTDLDYVYVWTKNGVTIPGETGIELSATLSNIVDDIYTLSIGYGTCLEVSTDTPVHMVLTPISNIDSGDRVECYDLAASEPKPTVVLNAISTDLEVPTYQWYKGSTAIFGETGASYTVTDDGDYSLETINDGYCTDLSDPINVVITPSVEAKITPNGDVDGCDEVVIKSAGSNYTGANTTYEWYLDDVLIPNAISSSFSAKATGKYYFIAYNYGACGSQSEDVNITLLEFDHEIVEGPVVKECTGNNIILTADNNDSGYTFAWYKQGGALPIGTGKTLTIIGDNINSGLYYLEVEGGSCAKTSDLVEVIIKNTPISEIELGSGSNCEGSIVAINSKESDLDYDYTWYFNDVEITGGSNYSGINSPKLSVSIYAETEGDYKVKVSIGSCVGVLSTGVDLDMEIVGAELNSNSYDNILWCDGSSIILEATAKVDLDKYEWYRNDVQIPGSSATLIIDKSGVYTAMLTTKSGCTQKTNPIFIETNNKGISADLISDSDDNVLCGGCVINLEAVVEVDVTKYEWYRDGELIHGDNNGSLEAKSSGTYFARVISVSGCIQATNEIVIVDPVDEIQNIITPNGDGWNDTWTLPNGFINVGDEVVVLNRQGSIVFSSHDYRNDWGGTASSGATLPAATYYYIIKRQGKDPVMGSITIFR